MTIAVQVPAGNGLALEIGAIDARGGKTAIAATKRHGDSGIDVVHNCDVRMTVVVEVACGKADRRVAGDKFTGRMEGTVAIAEQHAEGVGRLVHADQIGDAIAAQIGGDQSGRAVAYRIRNCGRKAAVSMAKQDGNCIGTCDSDSEIALAVCVEISRDDGGERACSDAQSGLRAEVARAVAEQNSDAAVLVGEHEIIMTGSSEVSRGEHMRLNGERK